MGLIDPGRLSRWLGWACGHGSPGPRSRAERKKAPAPGAGGAISLNLFSTREG